MVSISRENLGHYAHRHHRMKQCNGVGNGVSAQSSNQGSNHKNVEVNKPTCRCFLPPSSRRSFAWQGRTPPPLPPPVFASRFRGSGSVWFTHRFQNHSSALVFLAVVTRINQCWHILQKKFFDVFFVMVLFIRHAQTSLMPTRRRKTSAWHLSSAATTHLLNNVLGLLVHRNSSRQCGFGTLATLARSRYTEIVYCDRVLPHCEFFFEKKTNTFRTYIG